jgi:Flp pilus assembly protein TadD
MFVAMARSAGLEAWYREVDILPEWTNVDDTLLVSKHVNAEVHDRLHSYVVDVSRRQVQKGERARRLSDQEAAAQFYNNLGANALVGNDLARAYAYFRKAAETAPAQAYAWSNLGVVLRRNGQTEDAMLAYQTAMRLDPDQAVAVNNLYTIYDEDGQLEAAQELQARVERNRRRNPYYLHYLAEVANEEHRWEDAQDLARRAIRIEPREYRFYYTLARAQFHNGNERVAQTNLNRARSLAPPGVPDEELELPGED